VQSLLGVDPQMGEGERRAAVVRALEQGLIGAAREALLYDLVDVAPPAAAHVLLGAMSVTARERGTLEALGELVSNLSRSRPLVLLVEDIKVEHHHMELVLVMRAQVVQLELQNLNSINFQQQEVKNEKSIN